MSKPILHGTATLALAISAIVENELGSSSERISRVGCRFSFPVFLPEKLTLEIHKSNDTTINFELLTKEGGKALQSAYIEYR